MNNPQAYCDFQLCSHPKCWQSFRTAEINFNKHNYMAINGGLKSLPNKKKPLVPSTVEQINKPVLDLLPSYNIQNITMPYINKKCTCLTSKCFKYEKFKDEMLINYTRLVNTPESGLGNHVVKFDSLNKVNLILPQTTNNQDKKKMLWKPSEYTKVKAKESLVNQQRAKLKTQKLSIENFATRSFNLRGSMLVKQSIGRLTSTATSASSETFKSKDMQQVMQDIANLSDSERIKLFKEVVNEKMISLEDANFVLKNLGNEEISLNPITEGNKLAVDTKVNFKSSIQDVVNLVNSYVTLYNNSKNFVVSNSTLISNEKKNQSSSNNSQKISKDFGSTNLMETNEISDQGLEQSDFFITSCYKLDSDTVASQTEKDNSRYLNTKRQLQFKKRTAFSKSSELKNSITSMNGLKDRLSVISLQIDKNSCTKFKTSSISSLSTTTNRDGKVYSDNLKVSQRFIREPDRRKSVTFLLTSAVELKERKVEKCPKNN